MGFRLEGNQVRRGPVVVEAPHAQEEQPQDQGDQPQAQEEQPQDQGDQPQAQEEQPPAEGDQPQGQEDQPPLNEDQPQVPSEGDIAVHAPLSPQFQPSSIHSESPQPTFQPSTSSGGPSVPPELFSFLNDKFETLNSSIQTMSETFELRIQRLENTVSAKFIEQKAASDYAAQRFNRLIGTLGDASIELKEHQEKLEQVLKGILANSQADVFNTKQTLHEITSTRLSFAHFVDDLESMRNFNAHIDNQISDLTKEFRIMQRPVQTPFAKEVSTHPTMVSTQQPRFKGKKVDALSGQVDTGLSSQNSLFSELGQQVDTTSEQVDTGPCSQNSLFSDLGQCVDTTTRKHLKRLKEAYQVGAFVGEDFKEDPQVQKCRASTGTSRIQASSQSELLQGSTLKNKVDLSMTSVDTATTEIFFLWTGVDLSGDCVNLALQMLLQQSHSNSHNRIDENWSSEDTRRVEEGDELFSPPKGTF
ncbi:hypothetical protein Taro_000983 [Colocasia esculenta]|uniref:Uncharacterized protein n=1 Tax=Colocasia esculenta TaxID=4460 RepID=A0A843TGT7_COLES|nr:hypothetical protein [Colocasia esculenta]